MRPALVIVVVALALAGCSDGPPSPGAAAYPSGLADNPFLRPGPVVVQIDHAPGRAPPQLALAGLAEAMGLVGTPPRFDVRPSVPAGDGDRDAHELRDLHAALYRGHAGTWRDPDGAPVLHVLFLDGSHADQPTLLGQRLNGTPAVVLFPDLIGRTRVGDVLVALPHQDPDAHQRRTLVHEYGHILGLVGCGLPVVEPHGSGCHSDNPESVMAPTATHAQEPVLLLRDGLQPVWRFDDDDWADIRAHQATLRPLRAQS